MFVQLIFNFGWILVFLTCMLQLWPISFFFNELISHGVFLFFTIWYIRLFTYATKIVTLQLHYVLNTYLPNNNKCTYIPTNRRKTIIYNLFLCFWLQATLATKNHPTSNNKSPMTFNCKQWMIFCICKICINQLYTHI